MLRNRLNQNLKDNDLVLAVLLFITSILSIAIIYNLTQEPTTQSNIFEGIGVVVALLSICASHYQMKTKQESTERQIRELQKKRLQPEYEERVEIIDNSIAKASQNIECLTGKGFTGNIDTIFELENIEPYHQNISKKITQNLLIAWVNIENYSGS